MRLAYADPPYPGCAHLYRDHPDYAGEVDHQVLAFTLKEYDGWVLHTSTTALKDVLDWLGLAHHTDYRVMAWVKPFAAFKRNVSVAYAWEPVIVKAARKPVVKPGMTYRDWIAEPITLKRGLTGAKPEGCAGGRSRSWAPSAATNWSTSTRERARSRTRRRAWSSQLVIEGSA